MFSIGPPGPGPNDPPVCNYGVVGAFRSATWLTVNSARAAFLWVVAVALTVSFVPSLDDGALGKISNVVIGVPFGTMLTYIVIAVLLLSQLGRRYHWTQKIGRYHGEGAAASICRPSRTPALPVTGSRWVSASSSATTPPNRWDHVSSRMCRPAGEAAEARHMADARAQHQIAGSSVAVEAASTPDDVAVDWFGSGADAGEAVVEPSSPPPTNQYEVHPPPA
ncbi:MAG: hypothetical protein ACRD0V_07575 [Acidimicrobiales bacterium]